MFDKSGLLAKKDEALHFIYEETPVCRMEVEVTEGFAVAEVKLQNCKEDTDNTDWENRLDPDKGELKTAELFIKVEVAENGLKVVNDGVFLEGKPFNMNGTTVVQDIYHDGKIGRVEYQVGEVKMKKVKFIYHDSSKKKHKLGKFNIVWAQKWKDATKHSWKGGDLGWKKVTVGGQTRYYQYDEKRKTPLVTPFNNLGEDKLFSYSHEGINIELYEKTDREYHNPIAMATIFGALAEVGFSDVVCNGSVGIDATGAYSLTHYNGISTDFKFLRKDKKKAKIDKDANGALIPIILSNDSELDIDRQNTFIDALHKFGWGVTEKNLANKTSENKKFNHCKNDSHHWNHLHIQGIKPNYKN
ncbi:hypothetical protein [Tamlana sp. I1]|uniref:hypothetical protein n=1 Tax=Tamlana sp. I1 TaxID=2762061 RepID=UPI00188DC836|nr:hypothetical protein [Tamlana sp. I1]